MPDLPQISETLAALKAKVRGKGEREGGEEARERQEQYEATIEAQRQQIANLRGEVQRLQAMIKELGKEGGEMAETYREVQQLLMRLNSYDFECPYCASLNKTPSLRYILESVHRRDGMPVSRTMRGTKEVEVRCKVCKRPSHMDLKLVKAEVERV